MKTLGVFFVLFVSMISLSQASVECIAGKHKFLVHNSDPNALKVTYLNETVLADGIVDQGEVDFVAKFSTIGEMTLFAKRGVAAQDNYAFIEGRRISANCR